MALVLPYPRFKASQDDGSPAVGWKVYAYESGTTTPLATYADQTQLVENANPVILDGNGEASIWLDAGSAYKLILKDENDVVQWTLDAINTPDELKATTLELTGQLISTVGTGTSPLVVASTTKVDNLNADKLDGKDWATPDPIGSSSPSTIAGTTVSATSLTVGSGTPVTQIKVYTPSLSPVAVIANTTTEQTFSVPGLTTADKVFVNKPTAQAGLGIVGVRVSAADTLAITFSNNTGSPITPTASEAYLVIAIRS